MADRKDSLVIYHNPRCSKSRNALALLEEAGHAPTVIEYLKTPLTAAALRSLLTQLQVPAESLVRKSEEIYKERFKDREMNEAQWIDAMAEYPVLMERPIVVRGARAVVARPPERVWELFDS